MKAPRLPVSHPLAATVNRSLSALQNLHPDNSQLKQLNASQLMGERAFLNNTKFRSGISAGGYCRIIYCKDQAVAVNLPRDIDWELIAPWLQVSDVKPGNWHVIYSELQKKHSSEVVERARLIGLAVSPTETNVAEYTLTPQTPKRLNFENDQKPTVLDLSSLWAGPLCSHLLAICGAKVIKLESLSRPDGARLGNKEFYNLLNQGKQSVAVDLPTSQGRQILKRLIDHADIVIESSRPRAMEQMGINPEKLVAQREYLTWVSITGYGRKEPNRNWIAYGDDAGVAAGMTKLMRLATGHYEFAGDAIADPITGIHGALLVWQNWLQQKGGLISLSLRDVTLAIMKQELRQRGITETINSFSEWWLQAQSNNPHQGIIKRPILSKAEDLGSSNERVGRIFKIAC